MVIYTDDKITVYQCNDNRLRSYNKSTKKVTSYPRILMEEKLGRPLKSYEQVHHKNENTLDNDYDNLSISNLGDHQRYHSKKYFDKIMICPKCNRPFLWTAKQQRYKTVNENRRNKIMSGPFCSKHCAGSYSRKEQLGRNA